MAEFLHRGGAVEPLLQVDGLSVTYDQFLAVENVNLVIGKGEIVSIIGANGAGKSTLLRAFISQSGTITGQIMFRQMSICGLSTADIIRSGIALVPEGRQLFPSLSVEENLRLGWEVGRRGGLTLDGLYDLFPVLRERRRQSAGKLSGGQQQLVAFGRALLADPELLLCDEISLGLAPKIVDDIYAYLPKIREQGMSIVVVEQDLVRALDISDRFYCMLEGRVSLEGRSGEHSFDEVSRAYFGAEQ